jgi:Uma2 family endonuclease
MSVPAGRFAFRQYRRGRMNEVTELEVDPRAPAGYRLGDPIALEDLLALPPDGRRYTRDAEGRLALMVPDDPQFHRAPLSTLLGWFWHAVQPPTWVSPEPGIGFSRILSLQGRLLPPSRLGPKVLEPDLTVFAERPSGYVVDDRGVPRGFDTSLLRLVVEVISPGTHRQDLGLGAADDVDRPRSYLESGVPEYWVVNANPIALGGLPPRSGLFLRAVGGRWAPLDGADLVHAATTVLGLRPVLTGRVRSPALGREVDLDALWSTLLPRT